jgi:acyl-CoA thioester hydrolase
MNERPIAMPYEDRLTVLPEWLDPNGHMNVAFYLRAVDDGSNAFFDDIDLGWDYTRRGEGTVFVTGCNLDFRRELFVSDDIRVTTQLLDCNEKLLHCYSEVWHAAEGYLAAAFETLYMHVLFATRRGAPMPALAQARLARILAAHRDGLPEPATRNRPLGISR